MKTAWITLDAKDSESAQNLKDSLLNLLALSGSEPGKVAYEVFTAESDENQFHVKESWSDGKAFETHLNTPHLKAFTADINDWLSGPMQATMLQKVEPFDNKQVIEKLHQAVNAKNLEYIRSLGADFSEWLDVPFDYGKIERADSYFDFYGLLRQLAPEKVGVALAI